MLREFLVVWSDLGSSLGKLLSGILTAAPTSVCLSNVLSAVCGKADRKSTDTVSSSLSWHWSLGCRSSGDLLRPASFGTNFISGY